LEKIKAEKVKFKLVRDLLIKLKKFREGNDESAKVVKLKINRAKEQDNGKVCIGVQESSKR